MPSPRTTGYLPLTVGSIKAAIEGAAWPRRSRGLGVDAQSSRNGGGVGVVVSRRGSRIKGNNEMIAEGRGRVRAGRFIGRAGESRRGGGAEESWRELCVNEGGEKW